MSPEMHLYDIFSMDYCGQKLSAVGYVNHLLILDTVGQSVSPDLSSGFIRNSVPRRE